MGFVCSSVWFLAVKHSTWVIRLAHYCILCSNTLDDQMNKVLQNYPNAYFLDVKNLLKF